MIRCKELANEAAKGGNTGVGAVLVYGDNIVAEGKEATADGDITRHAELEAIRKVVTKHGKDLSGHVLITTHEPCVMCSYAIRYHRIDTVVYEQKSEYLGGASSSFKVLETDEVPNHWGVAPTVIHFKN
ncbi:MAG: nucleoside deaminase [Ekhidna sp.]|nr:nucleoside deaminase [Ekhidna sp.]